MTRRDFFMRIGKAAALYVIYLLISFWTYASIVLETFRDRNTAGFWEGGLPMAVSFFYTFLILFSLLSVFVLHDIGYRARFASVASSTKSFGKKLSFVLRSSELWIDVLTLSALSLIIQPVAFECFEFGFLESVDTAWHLPLCFGVFALGVALLSVVAYISTLNWWSRPKELRREIDRSKNVKAWIKQLIFSIFMYLLAAPMLTWVVPFLYSVFATFKMLILAFTVAVVIGIIAFILLKYLRALRHRRRLMKKMKRALKNGYCRLVWTKDVYRSVFRFREGANICLERDGKKYYCKIITPLKKKHTVYFAEDGWVTVERHMVMAMHYRSDRYFFDADEGDRKILIINPGAIRVYATDTLRNRELHSGDKVMGYYLYRTDNFINGIERGYL